MISGRMTSYNEECRRLDDDRNSERPTKVISAHTHTFLRTPLDVPYTETYIGQPSASKSASVQTTTPFVRRTLTRCQPLLPLPSDSISKLCSSLVVPPTNEVSPLDCCCLFLQAPLPSPFAVNRSLSQERRPPLLPQTAKLEMCELKTFVPNFIQALKRMSCLNMLLNTWYSPDLIPTVTPMTDPF